MPRKTPKPWTVLIYMVADDPQGGELLDQRAVQEMDKITKAALSVDTDLLNVAVQVDFRTLPGVWRRVIGESTFVRPESNAAAPATLYGFFEWAASECPAEHYLLIFWGHTRGQFGMFGDSDPFEYTAQTLTLSELREALAAAKRALEKPVDIIAFKDCFMATLETAYELAGLADFLLASPDLVPVVGWPYDEMFQVLTTKEQPAPVGRDRSLADAKRILEELRVYYDSPKNRGQHAEVPYALLSTQGADAVVKELEVLVGKGHTRGILPEEKFRSKLNDAAMKAGDPALADLGVLVAKGIEGQQGFGQSFAPNAKKGVVDHLNDFAAALGKVKPDGAAAAEAATAADAATKAAAEARAAAADAVAAKAAAKAVKAANAAAAAATRAGAAAPAPNAAALAAPNAAPVDTANAAEAFAVARAAAARAAAPAAPPEQLVIDHTGGPNFGGVSVFVYPSTPKAQRNSRLTRLADEKVYKRLAISADTNWADIALQSMPIKSIGSRQPDVSTAVGLLEQLQRLGVGRAPGSAAGAGYLRRLPLLSRNRQLSGAGMAQAAEYATVVELAARLADFAAKAGDDFVKAGDDFAKAGDDFAKAGDDFVKAGDDFGPR